MKRCSALLLAWAAATAPLFAQDATTLQVAPSDQIRYPDASQVLNKTEARPLPPAKPLPQAKPLLLTTPVPAAAAAAPAAPVAASAPAVSAEGGWYVKWVLAGSEEAVLGWAQGLGLPAALHAAGTGQWEVWAGPLDAAAAALALRGQAGKAVLVRR